MTPRHSSDELTPPVGRPAAELTTDTPPAREFPTGELTYSTAEGDPYYLEPEARPFFEPPTMKDRGDAVTRRVLVLPPADSGAVPEQEYSGRGLPLAHRWEPATIDLFHVYQSPEWLAFSAAADRARDAARRAAAEADARHRHELRTTCHSCGSVGAAQLLRVVEMRPLRIDGIPGVTVDSQLCPPCAHVMTAELANRYALNRLPDGRHRLAAVRDHLDRLEHDQRSN
jgi:hypothetical protein